MERLHRSLSKKKMNFRFLDFLLESHQTNRTDRSPQLLGKGNLCYLRSEMPTDFEDRQAD